MTSSAASAERREPRPINRSFSLSFEDDAKLTAIAEAIGDGKRSRALAWLIDRYHGLAIERADQQREVEERDQTGGLEPWRVVRFNRAKLTPELVGYIAGQVRAGLLPATACKIAGVTDRQRAQWTKTGRVDRSAGRQTVYADFVANVEEAEALVEAEDVRRLREFAQTNPRVLQWILERMRPETYAERKVVDKRSTVSVFPVLEWDLLTQQEVRTLIALIRKASPSADDPRVTRTMRPAVELLPPEVIEEAELVDGEATEAPPIEDHAGELQVGAPDSEQASAELEKPGS